MKTGITLLYLFLSITALGQNTFGTPYVKFYKRSDTSLYFNKKLGITDKDAVIIATDGINEIPRCNSYLVLLSNGSMFKYAVRNDVNPNEIKKKEVTDSVEKQKFLGIIKEINSFYRFNRDDFQSLMYWRELERNLNFLVLDGTEYSIYVMQGDKEANYNSYAADVHIEYKTPGFDLKKQFVKVINDLDFSNEFFGKPFAIPDLSYQESLNEVGFIIKMLRGDDEEALIIHSKLSVDLSQKPDNYLVIHSDGTILRYRINNGQIIEKDEVIAEYRRRVLYSINKLKEVDASVLFVPEKTLTNNDGIIVIENKYCLQLYKGNSYSKFEVQNPFATIENKTPDEEMKKKLLDIMRGLNFGNGLLLPM